MIGALLLVVILAVVCYVVGYATGFSSGISEGYSQGKELIMTKVEQNAIYGYEIKQRSTAADRDAR